ncbi:hypothetical protein AB1Y20_016956 [Prymnesium parvum]|uniref:Uncharacterized protein n=1 Tax=Prymnesium parvum TaxID=97485 RepID=A0AB34IA35_PRYPA
MGCAASTTTPTGDPVHMVNAPAQADAPKPCVVESSALQIAPARGGAEDTSPPAAETAMSEGGPPDPVIAEVPPAAAPAALPPPPRKSSLRTSQRTSHSALPQSAAPPSAAPPSAAPPPRPMLRGDSKSVSFSKGLQPRPRSVSFTASLPLTQVVILSLVADEAARVRCSLTARRRDEFLIPPPPPPPPPVEDEPPLPLVDLPPPPHGPALKKAPSLRSQRSVSFSSGLVAAPAPAPA